MQLVQSPRASTILYNLLVGRADSRPWLLPANICPIVPITFLKARIPFEFLDISPTSLHLDLDQAEARLKERQFGGLLYAHTYGEPSTPLDFFSSIKSSNPDLLVVDDRCLCAPDLEPIHTAADLILYSTGHAKIAELGAGGYAFLRDGLGYSPVSLPFDPAHHDEVERSYKQSIQNREKFVYKDSDWLQTSAPSSAWYDYSRHIETRRKESLAHREALNRIYQSRLPQEIQLPARYQTWRFNIRVKNKTGLLTAIFNAGLFASSHYASLAGIMGEGFAPCAGALANEIINLFNDEHFDAEKANTVCDIVIRNL